MRRPIRHSGNSCEAGLLKLDSTRARNELDWLPRWRLGQALEQTIDWHRQWLNGADMKSVCMKQIDAYASTSTP